MGCPTQSFFSEGGSTNAFAAAMATQFEDATARAKTPASKGTKSRFTPSDVRSRESRTQSAERNLASRGTARSGMTGDTFRSRGTGDDDISDLRGSHHSGSSGSKQSFKITTTQLSDIPDGEKPYKVELVVQCKGDMTPPSTGTSDPATILSGQDSATATIIYGDDGQPMLFDEATGTFVAVDLEALNAALEKTDQFQGEGGEDAEIFGSEGRRSHHSSQHSRASDSRGPEAAGEFTGDVTSKSNTPFVPVQIFMFCHLNSH